MKLSMLTVKNCIANTSKIIILSKHSAIGMITCYNLSSYSDIVSRNLIQIIYKVKTHNCVYTLRSH
jgi:hypothetical protein